MNLVECYIEHQASQIDQTYTYQFDDEKIEAGMRVLVNFANRNCVAFVSRVEKNSNKLFDYEIKKIIRVLDDEAILNDELIQLAQTMAKTTISPMISCLQAMLPKQLKVKSSHSKIKMEKWVRILSSEALTKKQQAALDDLLLVKEMKRSEWLARFKTVAKACEKLGYVEVFEKECVLETVKKTIKPCPFELSDEQKNAVHEILHASKQVCCLHGVTGSGKSEVFLHCANEVLKQGKQVIMLVPEISLTPLMVKRVTDRFGDDVAIYHSSLSDQEKYEQYQSIKRHEKNIVVGTRSAIFMPFDNLGLIILDEEHDLSYKQDVLPRYHARDIAIERAKYHNATVVLASATPSLETYARAIKNVYQLVTLKNRVTNTMPYVHLVDMQKQIKQKDSYILSKPLREAMQRVFENNQQVILLLNRRGYQPTLRCLDCGKLIMCPHCDRALVYHKESRELKCHLCGYTKPIIHICPNCQSKNIKGSGFGTQMLEEEVQKYFPDKKIIRMDADTTSRKNAHEKLLEAFGNHEADILLGTQMIAKGLDFENVTLVGILQGDGLLARNDYRCSELTFDLLCQASGRSGRGDITGEVYIQCFDTQHYAIKSALSHDYLTFFKHEMQYRHLADYPPYTYLCNLIVIGKDSKQAEEEAYKICEWLKQYSFKVLGVSELGKQSDEYRFRCCVKSKSLDQLQQAIYELYQIKRQSLKQLRLNIDMNPCTME